MRSNINLQTLL